MRTLEDIKTMSVIEKQILLKYILNLGKGPTYLKRELWIKALTENKEKQE